MCTFSARPFPSGVGPSEKRKFCGLRNHNEFLISFHSNDYFFNACAFIIRLNTPISCEHNRHISPYDKKRILFFEEIRRAFLRMCIFCSTSRAPTLPMAIPPRKYVRVMLDILHITRIFENTAVPPESVIYLPLTYASI